VRAEPHCKLDWGKRVRPDGSWSVRPEIGRSLIAPANRCALPGWVTSAHGLSEGAVLATTATSSVARLKAVAHLALTSALPPAEPAVWSHAR
jgi:hypothetical protein